MSSLTFPSIVTVLILSILPLYSSTDESPLNEQFIFDDGYSPMLNRKDYYVKLLTRDGGYLVEAREFSECPLYITSESKGTPVRFSTPTNKTNIYRGDRVNLAFTGNIPCNESLELKSTKPDEEKMVYFTTGGGSSGLKDPPFEVNAWAVNGESLGLRYNYLKYCFTNGTEACSNVGLFDPPLLLGFPEDTYPFSFVKAFGNDEVSTS